MGVRSRGLFDDANNDAFKEDTLLREVVYRRKQERVHVREMELLKKKLRFTDIAFTLLWVLYGFLCVAAINADVTSNTTGGLFIYVDELTGCQYLSKSTTSAVLVPRKNSKGVQECAPKKDTKSIKRM